MSNKLIEKCQITSQKCQKRKETVDRLEGNTKNVKKGKLRSRKSKSEMSNRSKEIKEKQESSQLYKRKIQNGVINVNNKMLKSDQCSR